MKIRYSKTIMDIIQAEGITQQEVAEAIRAIEGAAAGRPRPLHLNDAIEGIRDTNLIWYRLKPKGASYRIVFSIQRASDTLTVEGIYRRNATTYERIARLFEGTPDRK